MLDCICVDNTSQSAMPLPFMHTPPLNLLLANALEQVLANPTASHRWHTLGDLYWGQANAAQQSYLLQQLALYMPRTGEVGFFYATFMAECTKDLQYSALAGQILPTITPFNADRQMAFCVYEWGRQVSGEGSRQHMAEALRLAGLPTAVQHMGQVLAVPRKPAVALATPQSAIRRVALISPYISSPQHPPTLLALQHAGLLAAMGAQAHVFSAQELQVDHMSDYLGSKGMLHLTAPDLETLRPHMAPGVSLTLCDARFSVSRRSQDLLQAVTDFTPDLVLFVGMFSHLMLPMFSAWPTLGLCVHALQPMAAVDAWLTSDPAQAGQLCQSWGLQLPPAMGIYHPYRVARKPIIQPVTRAGLGLRHDAVVLVSAGARLATEVANPWAARMLAWLQQQPNAVWLLVGGAGQLPPALQAAGDTEAIRFLPHQDDLRSVLLCTDIYVNPQRLGGGFSVAEAMAEGLAVVALADGDGGDKVGAAAAPTLDAYFDQLTQLMNEPATRQAAGAALQQRFAQTLDLDNSGPALWAACHTAQQLFAQRQSQQHSVQ
jgi:glycosyltransferase involved in cell wall biosynthesis